MLVGAALGSKIQNFWALLFIGLALHYALDTLPHWEYSVNDMRVITTRRFRALILSALIDLAIGIIILWQLGQKIHFSYYMLWGAFISIVPDGLTFLQVLLRLAFGHESKILGKILNFHHAAHLSNAYILKNKKSPLWGIAAELLVIALSFFILLR